MGRVEKMNLNRKADANMWWIIIGAIIALVVLIVLMLIFTGKTNVLSKGLLDCRSKGGECLPVGSDNGQSSCTNIGGTVSNAFECETGFICCFKETKKLSGK